MMGPFEPRSTDDVVNVDEGFAAALAGGGLDDIELEGTQVTNEMAVDEKLSRLSQKKREFTTPNQSPAVAPPATKARHEAPLPDLPSFPAVSTNSSSSTEQRTAEPSNADIMSKLTSMMGQMALKSDLTSLRQEITQDTRASIAEAVVPIKSEIAELRERILVLEKQKTVPSASSGSSYIPADIKIILDSLDPAHKRIVFSGFPLDMACKERTKHIEKFLVKYPSLPKYISVGVIPKGPKNNRTATKMSFVEFSSSDDAYSALKLLKSEKLEFGSASITIKGALTKVNGTRNYSLGAAEK